MHNYWHKNEFNLNVNEFSFLRKRMSTKFVFRERLKGIRKWPIPIALSYSSRLIFATKSSRRDKHFLLATSPINSNWFKFFVIRLDPQIASCELFGRQLPATSLFMSTYQGASWRDYSPVVCSGVNMVKDSQLVVRLLLNTNNDHKFNRSDEYC